MKKFAKEFSDFINRGDVMDMAVGIIIGGAFTGIVNALIEYIINPLITAVTGGQGKVSGLAIPIPGSEQAIDFGAFLSAIINFLIIAFVIFLLVKGVNKTREAAGELMGAQKEVAPTPRVCPYCKSEIAKDATRCPNCTSILPNATKADKAAMQGEKS